MLNMPVKMYCTSVCYFHCSFYCSIIFDLSFNSTAHIWSCFSRFQCWGFALLLGW